MVILGELLMIIGTILLIVAGVIVNTTVGLVVSGVCSLLWGLFLLKVATLKGGDD
ncbi:hypothetical protein JDW15_04415 [Aerococcaceae bacterium zg-ZJ1578]|uniref:hypothetical protein n=1 Tax=Aerococcaceae bacterium zg-252 TaxID=2796928 RepID=UPI001A2EC297|nr:hypothetical protein [Aerococcaceae bacterium zg-1578]